MKHLANEPVDRMMTFIGSSNLCVRSKLPLNTIIPLSEADNPALEVPKFSLDPVSIGGKTQHNHIANIPGIIDNDSVIVNII